VIDNDRFPPVPANLIEALDERFPDQCPKLDEKDRMIWFAAGSRAVVDFLVEMHKRQNETLFPNGE